MTNRCVICCADEMIVGRWYKIIAYPVGAPARGSISDAMCDYRVNYTCDADNVVLIHDTIYIKATGEFEIRCADMFGATASKTIRAIEEPTIERTTHEIIPESWDDFKAKIDGIGDNAYISIPKGVYRFDLTDEVYVPPSGVVIDFNDSIVEVTAAIAPYAMFHFRWNFNGLRNATIRKIALDTDPDYQCNATLLKAYSGDYHKIEHIRVEGFHGYYLSVGAWTRYWYTKPNSTSSEWKSANSINGYIADDGSVVESADAWTTDEMVERIETPDRSYGVGSSDMWIHTDAKLYDIAFYDAAGALIEIRRDQQFYKKYYYPANAAFVRYSVWQTAQPSDVPGAGDMCIFRMMGGSSLVDFYPAVREAWFDDIIDLDTQTGIFSGVGICQDVHLNRLFSPVNGSVNNWAFDLEDHWNSALGYTIAHSYFGDAQTVVHGAQGVSFVSTIMGDTNLRNGIIFPTFINCLCGNLWAEQIRGNATFINSSAGKITAGEEYDNIHQFGVIDSYSDAVMRHRMDVALDQAK